MRGRHVFISYSRRDGAVAAARIESALLAHVPVWRDTRDLNPALDFTAELEKAIQASIVVVVCVTSDARREDSYVRREIAFAEACGRPTVVARAEDELPPIGVVTLTYFELWRDWDNELNRLIDFCTSTAPSDVTRSAPEPRSRGDYLRATYQSVVEMLHDRVTLQSGDETDRLIELEAQLVSGTNASLGAEERVGLSRFLHGSHDRLLIFGDPGSGKTVTSLALTRDLASEALTEETAPIPVLLPAATALGADHEVRPLAEWLDAEVPVLGTAVEAMLADGRATLILDGLDELPNLVRGSNGRPDSMPRAAVLDLVRTVPRLVVTSRPSTEVDTKPWDTILRIAPLTDMQVTHFLNTWTRAELAQDRTFIDAVRSPLLLSIVAKLASTGRRDWTGATTSEEWRDLVFEALVEQAYNHAVTSRDFIDDLPPLNAIYRALGRVAIRDASFGGSRNLFAIDELQGEMADWIGAVNLVEEMGIIVRTAVGDCRFIHAMVRDHFAFREAERALGDESSDMRDAAAWALWAVPDPRAANALIVALDDPNEYVRGSAAGALGQIGDTRALPALRRLSSDTTEVVSRYGSTVGEVALWAISSIVRADAT